MVKRALDHQKDAACWFVKWVLNSEMVAEHSQLSDPAGTDTNMVPPSIMPILTPDPRRPVCVVSDAV